MKTSPLLIVVAILFSGVIGFFIGRAFPANAGSANAVADKTETEATISDKKGEIADNSVNAPSSDAGASTDGENPSAPEASNEGSQESDSNGTASEETKSSNDPNTGGPVLSRVQMGISDDKISEVLEAISADLEALKLEYDKSIGQDCSGIYHKMKDRIQVKLPALGNSSEYQYPDFVKDRSSRHIADWYFKQKNLLIVKDPVASRNSIRPGSVMFFGKAGKIFNNINIDMLTDRKNGYTKNGAIEHIAVVTSVRTDQTGNVKDYTMMHARYPGGPVASRSGSMEVQSTSAKNKDLVAPYPFGHWTQQWVAVANIATKQ